MGCLMLGPGERRVVGYFPAAEKRKLPRWATLGSGSAAQRTEISRRPGSHLQQPAARPQTAKNYSRTFDEGHFIFWTAIRLSFEKKSKSYMFLHLSYLQTIGSKSPRTASSKDRLKDLGPGSVRNHRAAVGKCSKEPLDPEALVLFHCRTPAKTDVFK